MNPTVRKALWIVALLIGAAVLFLLWQHFMPAQWRSPKQLGELLRSLQRDRFGVLYVLGVYALLASAFVPITALITGMALVFDPARAFAYALGGSLLSATLSWGVGRATSRWVLQRMQGPRLSRLRTQLHKHTFSATITARLLPVGNFAAINMLAGAVAVPLLPFVLGNIAGMLFGIAALTLLADRVRSTFAHPTVANVGLLVLLVCVVIGVSFGLQRVVSRRQRARSQSETPEPRNC